MFSQKIIKKCSSVTVIRSVFVAMLIGVAGSTYACSDSDQRMLGQSLRALYEANGNGEYQQFSVARIIGNNVIAHAERISTISGRCARTLSDSDERQAMLNMKAYADSFAEQANMTLDAAKKSAKGIQDTFSGGDDDSVFGILLGVATVIGQSTKGVNHEKQMVQELNNMLYVCVSELEWGRGYCLGE